MARPKGSKNLPKDTKSVEKRLKAQKPKQVRRERNEIVREAFIKMTDDVMNKLDKFLDKYIAK